MHRVAFTPQPPDLTSLFPCLQTTLVASRIKRGLNGQLCQTLSPVSSKQCGLAPVIIYVIFNSRNTVHTQDTRTAWPPLHPRNQPRTGNMRGLNEYTMPFIAPPHPRRGATRSPEGPSPAEACITSRTLALTPPLPSSPGAPSSCGVRLPPSGSSLSVLASLLSGSLEANTAQAGSRRE